MAIRAILAALFEHSGPRSSKPGSFLPGIHHQQRVLQTGRKTLRFSMHPTAISEREEEGEICCVHTDASLLQRERCNRREKERESEERERERE